MKAVRFHEYGDPDVLRLEEVAVPEPGPGQVRVRVAATTFNGVDGNIRAGFMQEPIPVSLPHVPGLDVAGTVDALGEGVTGLAVGDAVVGFLRAYGKALEMWRTKPEQAAEIVAKQAGVDAATAAADMKEYDFVSQQDQLSPTWLGTEGKPGKFVTVLKRTADFLVQQRSIRSAPALDAFAKGTNTSYLAKAIG